MRTALLFLCACCAYSQTIGATCTLGSSCAPYGGANVYTANHTVGSSDIGKLMVMNCSSVCTLTFEASPAATDWWGVQSIGSTVAAVSLNGKNYNGAASAPTLISFVVLPVASDGSNYFGQAPPVAGANITLTPSANGLTYASSAGGNASTLDLFTNRPAGSKGDQFFCTDPCLYSYIKGNSSWQALRNGIPATAPPTASNWTNVNSATLTDLTGGGLQILSTSGQSGAFQPITIAAPGSAYSFISCMTLQNSADNGGGPLVGALFSDGTKYEYLYSGQNVLNVDYNSTFNAFSSHEKQTASDLTGDVCFKLTDDLSTTKTFNVSLDRGVTWTQVLSEARTTNLTPTKIGFFVHATSSFGYQVATDVFHYVAQ